MKPALLILAAGLGSRYGGLKQMDPLGPNGETIIDYSIYDALRAGFKKLVFVIRQDFAPSFIEKYQSKLSGKIQTEYVFQEIDSLPLSMDIPARRTKPWGTGHALWTAKNKIDEAFAVINADDYYGTAAFKKMANYLQQISIKENNHYCMIAYPLQKTLSDYGSVSRGICEVDEENFLQSVEERTHILKSSGKIFANQAETSVKLTGNEMVSMNFWGFTPSIFLALEKAFIQFLAENSQNVQAEFFLPAVVNQLLSKKKIRVKVLPSTAQWFGITYPGDKQLAVKYIRNFIQQGIYPSDLWNH